MSNKAMALIRRRIDKLETRGRNPQDVAWRRRHASAWKVPQTRAEQGLRDLVRGFACLTDAMAEMGYKPHEDGALSYSFAQILDGVRGLLDGESGRFDCGELWGTLDELAQHAGWRAGLEGVAVEARTGSHDDDVPEAVPDAEKTYRVVRMYQGDHPRETISEGLSLEDAQAHCSDPETSSSTASDPEAVARTQERGPWFDGYEEE